MKLEGLSTTGLSDFYSAVLAVLAAAKALVRRGCGAWAVGVGGAYLPQLSHPFEIGSVGHPAEATDGSGLTKAG